MCWCSQDKLERGIKEKAKPYFAFSVLVATYIGILLREKVVAPARCISFETIYLRLKFKNKLTLSFSFFKKVFFPHGKTFIFIITHLACLSLIRQEISSPYFPSN